MLKKSITILIIIFSFTVFVAEANAGFLVDYQGKLIDPQGQPIENRDYPMEFKIWHTKNASKILWRETWTGTNKVTVEKGIFHVKLGQLNPADFDFTEKDGYYISTFVGCPNKKDEEAIDWNTGIILVKEIKLPNLEANVKFSEITNLGNLDEVSKSMFLERFSQLWQMVLDLFSNFAQKVQKALAEEFSTKKMTAEKTYTGNAQIESAQIINLEVSEKIQLYDHANNETWCVWIEKGEWVKVKKECKDYLGSIDISGEPENSIAASSTSSETAVANVAETMLSPTSSSPTSSVIENISGNNSTSSQEIIPVEKNLTGEQNTSASTESSTTITDTESSTTSENFQFEY